MPFLASIHLKLSCRGAEFISLAPAAVCAGVNISSIRTVYLLEIISKVFIIIIIKQGWQCKAGRERLIPYQFEDTNPTTPTHRMKEEKGKTVGDKK